MNVRPALLAAALAAAVVPAAVADAQPAKLLPQQLGAVDLRSQANVTIVSAKPFDNAGRSFASAGDVNGDGIDDVIVGAPGVDRPGKESVGAAYVVFGRRTRAQVSRASLTARGFRILGPARYGSAGLSVAPAGDVDGDGLDDVVVGSSGGLPAPGEPWRDGEAWIVGGRRDGRTVDLAAPGRGVTTLTGPPTFGAFVAGGHDVDGDGLPDVAIAASGPIDASWFRPEDAGVFVVRGGAIGGRLDVRQLGERGMAIRGVAADPARRLNALSLVQDMNGDGRAEVALGVQAEWTMHVSGMPGHELPPPPPSELLARVVYGRPAPATVDVSSDLGDQGFTISASGGQRRSLATRAIDGGGDVNGDGRGDIVLGDPGTASAHVVFGGPFTGTVDVSAGNGLTLSAPGQNLGASVAITGDANGDGLDDVLVGAPAVTVRGRIAAGAAYLVHGRRSAGTVDVRHLGADGFAMAGAHKWDAVGGWLSSAGDFNDDGRTDLLLGSTADKPMDGRGVAYIVYGAPTRH